MHASRPLIPATLLLFSASPAGAGPEPSGELGPMFYRDGQLSIRHEKLVLANGLELILVEDHRLPLIAFNLWVHAGPRNEAPGQTGFAHLFEHLMFAGTRHIARGEADRLVDAVGGTDANGSTDFDRTNYYFTLPSNQLELGLWIKADMLGYMLDQVGPVALANQQDVVRNERREGENQPYGLADEAVFSTLFPAGHPYRAAVIGSHADIQSIRLADVRAFADQYYRPNNATLALVGDFDPARAKALVEKYFGTLKPGPALAPVEVPQPRLEGERRIELSDRVELPRLTLAWHTPREFTAEDAALDLAAHVLAGGRASRLYQRLVYTEERAQSVAATQQSLALGSVFEVQAIARPGQTLDAIESVIDDELAALAAKGPTPAELDRALIAVETGLFQRLEKVQDLADLLNEYNQLTGSPDALGRDLARYRAVTPEAMRAAVDEYLPRAARVVVRAVPGEPILPPDVPTPPPPRADGAGTKRGLNAPEDWRKQRPGSMEPRALSLPAGAAARLENGLMVVPLPKPGVPLVSVSLVVRAGQLENPPSRPGLASFTLAALEESTEVRTAPQLAEALANLGVVLDTHLSADAVQLDLHGLARSLPAALGLLAELVTRPAFAPADLERLRHERSAALAQQREDPTQVAEIVANAVLHGPESPLGLSSLGDEASIRATTAQELREFWRAHYRPERAALFIAGDVAPAEVEALVRASFGSWAGRGEAAPLAESPTPVPPRARLVLVDKPGAPQTALAVVAPGPRADDRRAPAIELMNAALGGLFTSRINTLLREVKGYTYGVYSWIAEGRLTGRVGISGSVRTPVTGAALKDLLGEVAAIRDRPFPEAELERVRSAKLFALPGEFDTGAALASRYADAWARGLPPDHFASWPARLAAVTATEVREAARAWVDPGELIIVAVGDAKKVARQTAKLGRKPVERRDAAGRLLK